MVAFESLKRFYGLAMCLQFYLWQLVALIFGILVDRLNPGIVLTFGSLFLAMQVALFFNHLRNGGEYGLIFLPYLDLLQVSLVQFLRLSCDYSLPRFD